MSKLYDICKALRELRKAQHKTTLENFLRLCIFFDITPDILLGIKEF